MTDTSTAEPTTRHRAFAQAEHSPATTTFTMTGYCVECGTWDTHGSSCKACGFDFGGADLSGADD